MVKTLELIQSYHSLDKIHQNPIKFYKQLALNLKVDINYTRQENIHFQYDKTAILYFDQNYAHKFIPLVLEIDFDSFYPQILMSLNDCDKGVLKMMNTLQKYRNKAKAEGDIPLEKTIKMLQNTFIGCCGSQKEYCRPVADMYLHSQIMKKSRDSIRKLKSLVEERGFQCFFIQTDAVFCEIQNEDQGHILLELTKSIFPAKMKIHKQFYHWNQTHKYVSLVDNKPIFKSFARDCEFFGQFVEKFIQTRNPEYLLKAYDHPETGNNQSLLSSLSKAIIQFPDILKFLDGRVLIRTDFLENGQIRRISQFVVTRDINEFIEKTNQIHNGLVSFHEMIIHNDNLLVFDIDCEGKTDIDQIEKDIKTFIIHHPIIKQFFNSFKVFTSSYQNAFKTSLHITFSQVCLPLHIQQQLAIEAKQKICEYIDTQIYAIGKSLRLPQCPNVKQGYTKEKMLQSILQIDPDFKLSDYLFTKCNKVPIQNSFVTDCLFKKQFSINYTYQLSVEHTETIIQMMSQVLKDKFVTIRYIELTKDNLGIIKLNDNDSSCIICKRKHDLQDNRTKLRFVILSNDTVRITCFLHHLPEDEITINIPSGSLTRTISMQDIPLQNAKIINQKYILKDKKDKYIIPKYACHIIKSSLGSGKSEVFAQQFKKFKRVLLVSVRKCYTFANQKRFGLEDDQLYFHQGVIDSSAICQVESLVKVSDKVIYDLLIIDEFQSVLQQLYKPDKRSCLEYIDEFLRVIKQSERMLICDANLEQSSVNWIINSTDTFEYTVIENIYQTFKGNQAIIYNEFETQAAMNYLRNKIVNRFDQKQKSWIIVSQKNYQEDLARIIKSDRPNIQFKIFNGNIDSIETDKINNPDNTNRQLINNIEFFKNGDNFSQYDLILSNSSITSGLDVPTSFGFDFVGGIILTQQFNCQQLIQALHRPRSVQYIEIFCQSLQTQRAQRTFFDHFLNGISTESHIDLHQVNEQLYSLCRQYMHDLAFLGIEYLYFWLQKMGYNLQIKTFQQQQEITQLQIGSAIKIPKHMSQSPFEVLERFMQFMPDLKVQDPYLMKIQDMFKDQYKNDNQQIFNDLIELSRYQINAQYNSEGYDLYFEDKDWEVDPIQYTDLLKAYFNCGFNIIWNQESADFDNIDKLFKFVVQYCSILKVKGKTFLKDYMEKIRINTRMRKDLERFTQTPEFKDKKERYKFYRLYLGCPYKSEKCVEKHIQSIYKDNLLNLCKDELLKQFEKSQYSKSRGEIATYLGYYSIVQRKKIEGKDYRILELYDIDYVPEAF